MESENTKLKRLVAEQALDIFALKDVLTKKTPQAKKARSRAMAEEHGTSQRKACKLVGLHRSVVRYQSTKADDQQLAEKIKEIAYEKRRFGYRRIHLVLKREGLKINHKKVFRIYQACGLKVLKREARRKALGIRQPSFRRGESNQQWSLDFMHDALANGRRIKLLTVADDFTRECLAIVVDRCLNRARVGISFDHIIEERGKPQFIKSDNGTEFTSNAMIKWAAENTID